MAEAATKAAVNDAKNALVDGLKASGVNSLKLGVGVAVATFAVQVTILAAAGVIGAGEGFVKSVKDTARVNGR